MAPLFQRAAVCFFTATHPPIAVRRAAPVPSSKTKISRILVNGLYSFQLASGRGMAIGQHAAHR